MKKQAPRIGNYLNASTQPKNNKLAGFTIVELLIVIAVIGILAAISIVAYNGIQNRVNDIAVKNDLTNMAKKIHLTAADTGVFIQGGGTDTSGSSPTFPGFTFSPSKGSYHASGMNLLYCTGTNNAGENVFAIMSRSKSGETYRYTSTSNISSLGKVGPSWPGACSGISNYTYSYGFLNGEARSWVD